jgi:predicted HAD superfamily phosphohydrolase
MTIAFDLLQDHFHLSKHETGVLHQVMAAMKAGVGVKEVTALIMAAGLTAEDVRRLSECVARLRGPALTKPMLNPTTPRALTGTYEAAWSTSFISSLVS